MIDLYDNTATPMELMRALQDDYKARGVVAITDMRKNNPKGFIDVIRAVSDRIAKGLESQAENYGQKTP